MEHRSFNEQNNVKKKPKFNKQTKTTNPYSKIEIFYQSILSKSTNLEEIFNDQKTLESFDILLNYNDAKKSILEVLDLGIEYKFYETLVKLIDLGYEKLLAIYNNQPVSYKKQALLVKIRDLINCCLLTSNNSIKLKDKFHDYGVVGCFFKYLRCKPFIDELIANNPVVTKIVIYIIGTLQNISALHAYHTEVWRKENAVRTLLDLSEHFRSRKIHEISNYITLANIAADDEIEKLPMLRRGIYGIVDFIESSAKAIESDVNVKRIAVSLNRDSSEKVYRVAYSSIQNYNFHLIELFDALYRMAVNDSLKEEIYSKCSMDKYSRQIIYNGNETESEYALKLLWQLCFNEKVARDVYDDHKLIKHLNKIIDEKKPTELVKNANGIVWLVTEKVHAKPDISEPAKEKIKHVMISYNRENRDLCLKIKQELEKMALKVWIDVESISGSSLESMANAIENSFCVLMCMSEKYKMSPYCRAEAEYAFKINKPIIPLIMQQNYSPDGWLGIILGSKIFVDFTKYEYLECVRRLLVEVKNCSSSTFQADITPSPAAHASVVSVHQVTAQITNTNLAVVKWTDVDVKKWLDEKGINAKIVENVYPCNGEDLNQLHKIEQRAPEFFYQSISTCANDKIPIKDVVIFAKELKLLFS